MSDENNENQTQGGESQEQPTPAAAPDTAAPAAGDEGGEVEPAPAADTATEAAPAASEAPAAGNDATETNADAGAAETAAPTTAVPVTPTIKVTFIGAASTSVDVPKGTTVAQAVKAAKVNGNFMLRNANNAVVQKTTKLYEDTTITTVAPAAGG